MDFSERKKELQKNNRTVVRPLDRLDSKMTTTGRKKKMTPRRMVNAINKYFEWCEENDEIPSIKGMMIQMKMYQRQFYQYLQYPEFTDILEHARMIIANWAEMDVYNTKGMAAGKIAYMKNIHGWADKIDSTNTTTKIQLTAEQAREKIEQLAPRLLEALKNTEVAKQIVHDDAIDAEEVK